MQKKRTKNTVKKSLILFLIALLIAVPIRCFQFMTILEPQTGFYSEINFTVYLLNIVLIFFGVCFILLYSLSKKDLEYSNKGQKSSAMSLASFMLALTLVIASLSAFKNAILTLSNPTVAIYDSILSNIFKTSAGSTLLEAITAAVSCVYFILLGIDNHQGTNIAKSNQVIALFPVLWCIFRLMHRFMRTINFLNVSDLFYEMVMCVLLMLFFMAFAQVNSQINHEGNAWKLGAFGLPAALMSLICSLPRIFVLFTGNTQLLAAQSPVEWCDLATAVVIVVTLLSFIVSKKELKESEENEPAITEFEEGKETEDIESDT